MMPIMFGQVSVSATIIRYLCKSHAQACKIFRKYLIYEKWALVTARKCGDNHPAPCNILKSKYCKEEGVHNVK